MSRSPTPILSPPSSGHPTASDPSPRPNPLLPSPEPAQPGPKAEGTGSHPDIHRVHNPRNLVS